MFCSRVAVSLLTLYWLMSTISASALMTRNSREIKWQDLEPLPQNVEGDISMAEENGKDKPTQIETPLATIQTSTQHQNQFLYVRGKKEKRRRVIPLDSIGRFKM